MNVNEMSEINPRLVLEKFDRSKILEIYFSRLNDGASKIIPVQYEDLYKVELEDIRGFLQGQLQ